MYANIGRTIHARQRYDLFVDKVAVSSLICRSSLQNSVGKFIQPSREDLFVKDANNRRTQTLGAITLAVKFGSSSHLVLLYRMDGLGTPAILGCDFCDKYDKSIRRPKRITVLDDGTTVSIIAKTSAQKPNSETVPPIPKEHEHVPQQWARKPKDPSCSASNAVTR